MKEQTAPSDIKHELNGQFHNISGPLSDGESRTFTFDSSVLQSNNELNISLGDGSLSADAPPMQVDLKVEQPYQSQLPATYISANYTSVSRSQQININWTRTNAYLDVEVQGWDGSQWVTAHSETLTAGGNQSITYGPIDYQKTRLKAVAKKDGSNPSVKIYDDTVLFKAHSATAENATASPSGGATQRVQQQTLSINVTDPEFPTSQGDNVTVEWYVDGSKVDTTYATSNGTVSTTISRSDGSYSWHVELTDDYGLTSTSDTFQFTIDHYDPVLDNSSATPDGDLTGTEDTLSIDLSDRDFPGADGDSVTVEFFHKNQTDSSFTSVGSDTLSANGTATTTIPTQLGGTAEWYAVATDSYSQTTTSQTFSYRTPTALEILNETASHGLVNKTTVEITSYYGGQIKKESVSDGTLNLTGFPVSQPIIIRSNASGYYQRTAIIESVYDQNTAYLLNSSKATYLVRFDLQDPTGQYPKSETVLFIERDINMSGSVEWRTITGDEFGVKGVSANLVQNERYRLRIKNLETGDAAVIGAYTPVQSESVTISPGSAQVTIPESEANFSWNITENESANQILVQYLDDASQTDSIKVTIHERYNASNVLVDNASFSTNNLVYQVPMTANQSNKTWMAELYIDRGDGYQHFRVPIGNGGESILPADLDAVWIQGVGTFIVLITGMAFSQLNQGVGAITTSLVGGLLWYLGVLGGIAVGGAVVAAIMISVLAHYRGKGGMA